MPEHSGAWHLLADLAARYYEENPRTNKASLNQEEWFNMGFIAVQKAIELEDSYAKFYSTRARLYSLIGEYDKALKDIKIAIDKEDSSNIDYSMRISTYLSQKMRIESEKQRSLIDQRRDEI